MLNSNDTYYLEPEGGQEILHHTFYHTDQLPIKGGTCGHGHQTGHRALFNGLIKPLHQRVSFPPTPHSFENVVTASLNVLSFSKLFIGLY